MGFNIAGLIIKKKVALAAELETILECRLAFIREDVNFEDANSSLKAENVIDVLQSESGTLVLTAVGEMYEPFTCKAEIIQFIISEVSDTHFIEKYSGGVLVRRFIISQGEIAEEIGEGLVGEDDDITEKVWDWIDEYLSLKGNLDTMYEGSFKRYEIK